MPGLEGKIDNLAFNLRYMQEVVVKWQKNFKLINERFLKLENQIKEVSQNSTLFTTTTTTTNHPPQLQEP